MPLKRHSIFHSIHHPHQHKSKHQFVSHHADTVNLVLLRTGITLFLVLVLCQIMVVIIHTSKLYAISIHQHRINPSHSQE